MTSSPAAQFEFVVGNCPEQLKGCLIKKVKSHASRLGWKAHRRPADGVRRTKRRKVSPHSQTYEYVGAGGAISAEDRLAHLATANCGRPPMMLTIDYHLGGGRVDPFRTYPGQWKPFTPALVDHYIIHMAVDIPELDQPGNKGLLRSRWFPLVISDLAAFRAIMLLSAANMASINRVPGAVCHILQLKSEAIEAIKEAFAKAAQSNHGVVETGSSNNGDTGNAISKLPTSDAMIGAVAKMASYEAMHGNLESYCVHMDGLYKMVSLRGGLSALGLGGLLRRIIVWIDLNSSFLLQIPRYYPGTTFAMDDDSMEPNPERFVAA